MSNEEDDFEHDRTLAEPATARWRLTVSIAGDAVVTPPSLVFDAPVVVGRDRRCDVAVKHPTISLRHLRLIPARGGVIVQHVGSTNGFQLRGVTHVEQALAGDADEVRIGAATLRLSLVDRDAK